MAKILTNTLTPVVPSGTEFEVASAAAERFGYTNGQRNREPNKNEAGETEYQIDLNVWNGEDSERITVRFFSAAVPAVKVRNTVAVNGLTCTARAQVQGTFASVTYTFNAKRVVAASSAPQAGKNQG